MDHQTSKQLRNNRMITKQKKKQAKVNYHLPVPKEKLSKFLQRMAIEECHYLLIGDGSGSRREHPSGFACVLLDMTGKKPVRDLFHGAVNRATINLAELVAYQLPLLEILHRVLEERKRNRGKIEFRHVHIISDSDYVVKMADRASIREENQIIWDSIEMIKRQGVILHWHWMGRAQCELNELVDAVSKLARRSHIRFMKRMAKPIYQPQRYNQDG